MFLYPVKNLNSSVVAFTNGNRVTEQKYGALPGATR